MHRLGDARDQPWARIEVVRIIVGLKIVGQNVQLIRRRVLIDGETIRVDDVAYPHRDRRFVLSVDRVANAVRARRGGIEQQRAAVLNGYLAARRCTTSAAVITPGAGVAAAEVVIIQHV